MSVSLLKAVASDRACLVLAQWPVRFGLPLSTPRASLVILTGRISTPLGTDSSTARWMSGRARGGDLIEKGGDRREIFSKEIDDLNAEIAGFVGDLGDPDFDAPPGGCLKEYRASGGPGLGVV